jgi:hypothetical protein
MEKGRPAKGRKIEFSMRLEPALMERIDAMAEEEHRNRANMIEYLLLKMLQLKEAASSPIVNWGGAPEQLSMSVFKGRSP